MSPITKKTQHLLFLAILVFTAMGSAVQGGFVWDDPICLLQIAAYRNFDFGAILIGLGNGLEYQPVRDLTYLLDGAIWGDNPFGFHLTNVVLYLLNVGAVYLLAAELLTLLQRDLPETAEQTNMAFWTAALFAVHPLHVEPVAFITGGRNTLLAALFSFLATRAFCRFLHTPAASRRRLFASAGWFLLALLAKATTVSLPLFFLVLALVEQRRPLRTRLLATSPFLLMGGIGATGHALIAAAAGLIDPLGTHVPLLVRGAIAAQIPFFYLGKLLIPASLAADYGTAITPILTAPRVIIALSGLVLTLAAMIVAKVRAPLLFVAIAWYGATLVPVLYLFPSPMIVADRYAFLPSFGFCFAIAWLADCFPKRWHHAVSAAFLVLLCLGVVMSFQQTQVWRTGKSLWAQTLKVRPDSIKAMQNLGTNLFVDGEYDRALALFSRAQQLDPTSTTLDFFSGFLAYTRGDWPTAARYFRAALMRNPELMDALYYLGSMSEETGQWSAAAECYQRVLDSKDLDRGGYRQLATGRLQDLGGKMHLQPVH